MNGRTYVILPASEVEGADFSGVMQSGDLAELRYSLDGTKTVLKWIGEAPTWLAGKTQFNHEEIKAEMAGAEWSEPPEIPETN